MAWQDPITPLGLDIRVVVAGAAGGVVRWIMRPSTDGVWANIGLVVSSLLMAAYLAPIAAHLLMYNLGPNDAEQYLVFVEKYSETFMVTSGAVVGMTADWAYKALVERVRAFGRVAIDSLQYRDEDRGRRSGARDEPFDG